MCCTNASQTLSPVMGPPPAITLDDEAIFLLAYERIPVGIAHCAADTGHLLRINRQYCEITGYPREEMVRLGLRDIIHPEHYAAYHEAARRLFLGEAQSLAREWRFCRRDGTVIWVAITLVPEW